MFFSLSISGRGIGVECAACVSNGMRPQYFVGVVSCLMGRRERRRISFKKKTPVKVGSPSER